MTTFFQKRTDFIQLMINAHREEKSDTEHDQEFHDQHGHTTKRGLTKDEVMAQGVLFFLAGYETTAATISYLMYSLALYPDVQEKLYEEILNVADNKVGSVPLMQGEMKNIGLPKFK